MGIITTAGGLAGALTAIGLLLGAIWFGLRKCYKGAMWLKAWAVNTDKTNAAVIALGQQIKTVIGSNGGSTLFERLDALEDGQRQIASISDALKEPSILFDKNGDILSVNHAFRRLTGWAESDLQYGGWRAKFESDDDLEDWDDAVQRHTMYERSLKLRGFDQLLVAHIRPLPGARFIGWRGVFEISSENLKGPMTITRSVPL